MAGVLAPVRLAIVGCGNIAGPYARHLRASAGVKLVAVADLDPGRAQQFAAEHECLAYPTLDALLADDSIELVVNLTVQHAHAAVSAACLRAGKHVYSEKPLAMTYEEASHLLGLARERGVRLGASPFMFLGPSQQTAWKCIRDGRLGSVRLVYAEANWGRLETWHPAPLSFYEAGALFDVGVYPLSLVTAIFGPARRVSAYGTVLLPERVTSDGGGFQVSVPDVVVAVLEMAGGAVVRLTASFYVGQHGKQSGIEFHGDLGSLRLANWHSFRAPLEFAEYGGQYNAVPFLSQPPDETPWGFGVLEMVDALATGRPHRASGEHAAHVVEILCATTDSLRRNQPVAIRSDFALPAPMEWAL